MKQYISNRIREAFKITNIWAHPLGGTILDGEGEDGVIVHAAYKAKHQPEIGGYFIKYPDDGYESYCPADVFEASHREAIELDDTMPSAEAFAAAAELMCQMNFGQALAALHAGKKVTRSGWNGKGMFVYLVEGSTFTTPRGRLAEIVGESTEVTYRPHLDMKYADGTFGVWLASQSDILAEDWQVVD